MDWKMPAHEIVMLLLPSTKIVQTEYRNLNILLRCSLSSTKIIKKYKTKHYIAIICVY